jgi:hypothetical protein
VGSIECLGALRLDPQQDDFRMVIGTERSGSNLLRPRLSSA